MTNDQSGLACGIDFEEHLAVFDQLCIFRADLSYHPFYSGCHGIEGFHDLDQADRGVPVIIERKGIRYSLKAEPPATARRWKKSVIEILDPAVAEGQWTWDLGPDGLRFRGGRSRR